MGQCIVGDFIKYLVCIVLRVVKWKNGHLGEFLVGFVGVVGLCGCWVSEWDSGSAYSGCHELSENIWFVWSKKSYSGFIERTD